MPALANFLTHELANGQFIQTARLPDALRLSPERFEEFWAMHPTLPPELDLQGERKQIPRWHQAYGRDYEYSGFVSKAEPVPPILEPMLEWTQRTIDARTNGILVNWYDAAFEHRISQHKDSPIQRVPGSPIVTISLGESRTFQMFVRKKPLPFRVGDGDVVIIPEATNRRFVHSVPHLPGDVGRRISVTLRSFEVPSGA